MSRPYATADQRPQKLDARWSRGQSLLARLTRRFGLERSAELIQEATTARQRITAKPRAASWATVLGADGVPYRRAECVQLVRRSRGATPTPLRRARKRQRLARQTQQRKARA